MIEEPVAEHGRGGAAIWSRHGDSLSGPRPRSAVAEPQAPLLSPRARLVAAALGALLAAAALVIGLSGRPATSGQLIRACAQALGIAVPVAVGLFALRRDETNRFARLLVIGGLAWAPSMLAMSTESVPYSIGRLWAWGVLAWFVYLILAFPTGRLSGRPERVVVASAMVVVGALYLPTALLAQFPAPSPWNACTAACPPNAFMTGNSAPGWVSGVVSVREWLSAAVYFAAAAIVMLRFLHGSRVQRRLHGPVLAFALFNFLVDGAFLIARKGAPGGDVTDVLGLAVLLAMPVLVLSLLAGLLRWQFILMDTWSGLTPDAGDLRETRGIQSLLASAIDDPSLEVAYWGGDDRGWIDEDGRSFAVPPAGSRRAHTVVPARRDPIAVLIHDASPLTESLIREVVRGIALMALENQRIEARANASLRELSDSRARILATVDKERRRIERDLHDGAQQRLIAMKVAADHGAESPGVEIERITQLFRRIGADATAALDEVRTLAHGFFPPLLVDFGLVAALTDVARNSSVPTVVRSRGVGRYPQEIEAAVYFCCVEALQNAQKHADATEVAINLSANGKLEFEVRDNGHGFDSGAAMPGGGLANMRDRAATVGGALRIDSVVGGGTRVAGAVPVATAHVPVELERLALQATEVLEDALGIYRAVRSAGGTIVDFAVEYVNDAACHMVGLPREAQAGKTLGQLQPGYIGSAAFEWHRQALDADAPLLREESAYAPTSTGPRLQAAYEVRAAALGPGRLALVWREITDRKRAENQLRLRASAVASEAQGVCIVRAATGMIAYANPHFEKMLGYGSGELEGRRASELDWADPPLDFGFPTVGGWPPESGERRSVVRCRSAGGDALWCEVLIDGFDDPDLGWCWVASHRDVTEQHDEQERLDSAREHLREALDGLPLLAYSADTDLRCTVLVDGLTMPGIRAVSEGTDVEIFGATLAESVREVNRRVLVTRRAARVEVRAGLPGHPTVLLAVDPVLGAGGEVVRLVGAALDHATLGHTRELTSEDAHRRTLSAG